MPPRGYSRWPVWYSLLIAILLVTSCASNGEPENHPTPPGDPVGASSTACEGLLARADIQALLGDPTAFIDSSRIYNTGTGTCGLYNPRLGRYVLRVDITADLSLHDLSLRQAKDRPGAIVQDKNTVAFLDGDGVAARALVRLPNAYVVVFLRQGPFDPYRLTRALSIASKIAATVPKPFGTAEQKSDQVSTDSRKAAQPYGEGAKPIRPPDEI